MEDSAPGRFLVYRSSAGSGKTSILVSTFLERALSSDDPKRYGRILAITFTNKAAKEMKERVLGELDKLARGDEKLSPPTRQMVEKLPVDREKVQERAHRTLRHLLHNYSRLSISTIDRFVHRIVQQFARDLGVSTNFELVLDQEELLQRAVDLLVARAGTDQDLTTALTNFANAKAEDDKSWHIEKDLLDTAWTLLDEDGREHWEEIRELDPGRIIEIRKELDGKIRAFEQELEKIADEGLALIEQEGLEPEHFHHGKQGGVPSYFKNLKKKDPDKFQPSSRTLAGPEEDKWSSGKCPAEMEERILRISGELTRLIEAARDKVEREASQHALRILIRDELYVLSVLSGIEGILERIREEEDLLLISDLDRIIGDLIRQEPAPFIYERIGERYDDILFDEFQDTSLLQWKNFLPLVENSLSEGNTVLLVGDGKQAIYRWRNGDVEQFIQLPELHEQQKKGATGELEGILREHYSEGKLIANFRSAPRIVRTNNELFPRLNRLLMDGCEEVGLPGLGSLFEEGMQQEAGRQEEAGYLRFERVTKQSKAEKEEEGDRMIERTREWVRDLLQRANPSDIAILTRSNAEGAAIASALMEERIDVVSGESLHLDKSPEVNFIIELMRIVEDPSNELAKLSCIRMLLEREGRSQELHTRLSPYWEQEEKEGRIDIEAFWKGEKRNFELEEAQRLGLYQLAERAVRTFDLDDPPTPYLQFFLDELFSYGEKKGEDLQGFLEEWDGMKNKPSIKLPEETEAVRVMTIHSAKGLEFPIVILPGPEGNIKASKKQFWLDPDGYVPELPVALVSNKKLLEKAPEAFAREQGREAYRSRLDALNLLYVAMTRAQEALFVLIEEPPDRSKAEDRMDKALLRTLEDWQGEFPEEGGLEVGSLPERICEEREKGNKGGLKKIPHEAWDERIGIRYRAPEHWEVQDPDASHAHGDRVHRALARIRSEDELPKVLEEMMNEGEFDRAEKEEVRELLETVLRDEKAARFFRPDPEQRVLTERDIISPDSSFIRPDRVLIKGNKARVLEIKTGSKKAEHHQQLRSYAEALGEMGYETEAYLLYSSGPELLSLEEVAR